MEVWVSLHSPQPMCESSSAAQTRTWGTRGKLHEPQTTVLRSVKDETAKLLAPHLGSQPVGPALCRRVEAQFQGIVPVAHVPLPMQQRRRPVRLVQQPHLHSLGCEQRRSVKPLQR